MKVADRRLPRATVTTSGQFCKKPAKPSVLPLGRMSLRNESLSALNSRLTVGLRLSALRTSRPSMWSRMNTVVTFRCSNWSVWGVCSSRCNHSYWPTCRRGTGRSNHQMLRLGSSTAKCVLLTPSTAPPSSWFLRAMASFLSSFIAFLRIGLFSLSAVPDTCAAHSRTKSVTNSPRAIEMPLRRPADGRHHEAQKYLKLFAIEAGQSFCRVRHPIPARSSDPGDFR
ncbi:hypothetical protein PSPTO_1595 [Pseudomonas syringae pv. tomato str. DC3000]|uniref:Uncharacterized protein n=1 Tax=Pseudomonas syringae pv. tomato (strain ATCC BAA-871 / DC3000) TaxID=223283 RepID=Q886I4_PSESM|nr:hypothetical protein PSPTO_1595 [Pseudomonas syringae pv. tomato str. DC3000]